MQTKRGSTLADSESTSEEFIVESAGPAGLWGVFEDNGEAGYLYLYEPDGEGIRTALHVYNRTAETEVSENDIEVNWPTDETECTVSVRGVPRGAITLIGLN
jgi:hypothetical protein